MEALFGRDLFPSASAEPSPFISIYDGVEEVKEEDGVIVPFNEEDTGLEWC